MQRPGRHVVCLVVLIVIARRHAWVIDRSGLGLFHVTPSFMGARLAPGGRAFIIAPLRTART